jgi:hypothetical protein
MNAATYKIAWTAVAAALVIVMLGMAPRISAAQAEHLTHKEVAQLIANAKEPQDHMRLAQYYNSEADTLEEEAKNHEAMRESYRKSGGVKNLGSPTQTVAHCEVFIKSLRTAEKADRELAAEHEQMAKAAAQPAK